MSALPSLRTVGQHLIALLEGQGVDTVFGIPGLHTVELYRGLAASRIRHVTPRHEQGAGFMADGYARVAGKPGVCLLISGPGLTNALTAMAQARADRVPMVVISAVNARATLGRGRGHLHELPDQSALMSQLVLATRTLQEPAALEPILEELFAIASGPRPGPVHLEIPVDVMSMSVEPASEPLQRLTQAPASTRPASGHDAELERALHLCGEAACVVIVAGGGVVRAANRLRALAETLDAPVVSTVNARGVLAAHPLDVPASPSLACVRSLLAEADLVLAIGTEWGPTDFDMYERGPVPQPARLVRVDSDPAMLDSGPTALVGLCLEAGVFLDQALQGLRERQYPRRYSQQDEQADEQADEQGFEQADGRQDEGQDGRVDGRQDEWVNERGGGRQRAEACRASARLEIGEDYRAHLAMLSAVWEVLPEATVVGDSTQPVYAGNLNVDAPRPRSWFNSATGFGTLGYAPAAAIGAWLAEESRPVICLVGDGGLQFSLSELGSAHDVGADVVFLVWNNRGYGEIETAMRESGVEPLGVTPSAPDFVAIAAAHGLAATTVDGVAPLQRALSILPRPCLIEWLES